MENSTRNNLQFNTVIRENSRCRSENLSCALFSSLAIILFSTLILVIICQSIAIDNVIMCNSIKEQQYEFLCYITDTGNGCIYKNLSSGKYRELTTFDAFDTNVKEKYVLVFSIYGILQFLETAFILAYTPKLCLFARNNTEENSSLLQVILIGSAILIKIMQFPAVILKLNSLLREKPNADLDYWVIIDLIGIFLVLGLLFSAVIVTWVFLTINIAIVAGVYLLFNLKLPICMRLLSRQRYYIRTNNINPEEQEIRSVPCFTSAWNYRHPFEFVFDSESYHQNRFALLDTPINHDENDVENPVNAENTETNSMSETRELYRRRQIKYTFTVFVALCFGTIILIRSLG